MKEELVTTAQAATLLGIGCRQLQKMVRRGILKPHPTASPSTIKNRLFRITDVAALQEVRGRGINPEAAFVEARQSAMETRALRHELDLLKFVLGLDIPALPTDRDSLVALMLRAEDALRELPTQDPGELLSWARVFFALTESHFESITFHTEQRQPWRVFLNLGRRLCAGQNFALTRNDLELHNIYLLLGSGLRRARQAAYFHVRELYGKEYSARLFPEVKGCPHEDVIALSYNNLAWDAPRFRQ